MADAATTLVLRMQDDASAAMNQFGQTTDQATIQSIQMNAALTAMGSALTGVGSLLTQVDTPAAKLAGTFLTTGGAMLATTSAIMTMIPYIKQMITWLRSLAVTQAIVKALSGPVGWAQIGIGMAVAGAATAGIIGMTGGFSGGGGGGTTVNVNAQAFAGNTSEARKFASKIQRYSREESSIGR